MLAIVAERLGASLATAAGIAAFLPERVSLQAILSIVVLVGAIASTIWGARQKGMRAGLERTAHIWEGERDAERARADRYEEELADLKAHIAVLEQRTDVVEMERRLTETHEQILAEIAKGHADLLTLAGAIAGRSP